MKTIKNIIKTTIPESISPPRPNPYYPFPGKRPDPYPDDPDTEDEE